MKRPTKEQLAQGAEPVEYTDDGIPKGGSIKVNVMQPPPDRGEGPHRRRDGPTLDAADRVWAGA